MAEIFRPDFNKKPSHTPRRNLPDRDAPIVRDEEVGEKEVCFHEYVAVLMKSRVVVCRCCRRQLEPIEVLFKLTMKWENATWLDREIKERYERIAELKRIEQNTKARIKRRGGTIPSSWEMNEAIRERRKQEK